MAKIPDYGVYPAITGKFCGNRPSIETLKLVLKGGARMVQLREKEMHKRELLSLAKEYRKPTKKAGAILIINDHM